MFECPNCSANLRFDISLQKLKCSYCDTVVDPYEAVRENDAEEKEEYDVIIYTCSQCGGEIQSTGDMESLAAGFCSFCGSSTILNSRLSRVKRPQYIIPFKLDKEECKRKYAEAMEKTYFLPNELRDERYVQEFRGIYMPYWIYHVKLQNDVAMWGTKSKKSGDYIIADYYNIFFNLDYEYYGLAQDASSSFEDDIGERIVPFHVGWLQKFTPSFLSGFYADTSDVGEEVYSKDIEHFVNETTYNVIENYYSLKEYQLDKPKDLSETFATKIEPAQLALFPVWLLTYRKGNRVAYALVNGLTGKVVADTPVSLKKYLTRSFLLAIPIFLLMKCGQALLKFAGLGVLLQGSPIVFLIILALLILITLSIYTSDLTAIREKEEQLLDRGKKAAQERAFREKKGVTEEEIYRRKVKQQEQEVAEFYSKRRSQTLATVCLGIEFYAFYFWIKSSDGFQNPFFLVILALILIIINVAYNSVKRMNHITSLGRRSGFWSAVFSFVIVAFLLIVRPASLVDCYLGIVFALLLIIYSMIQLIHNYNVLATRKMPQYNYEGGEHHV